MTYGELEKELKKAKCKIFRQGARHTLWIAPNGKVFPVSRHKTQEVPAGTLKSIKRDAGLE